MTEQDWIKKDQQYIWHPLTQHKTAPEPLYIKHAKGIYLYDATGKAYIDAISSWYTSIFGHCHPEIINSAKAQLETLDQIVFCGLTHQPAISLAEALIEHLPPNIKKVFFSDNGSTAVEVALKLAIQYAHNNGEKKNLFVAFEDGFHGDTFGAMSTSGLSVYNGAFKDFFITVERIPLPNGSNNDEVLSIFENIIKQKKVAGFIYEPLIQGAAGMKIYCKKGLNSLIECCRANNILTIADEVMTGFGKTGSFFASNQLQEKPDILCLSKALTSGLVPLAATCCTDKIYHSFLDKDVSKGFFHGHTYTANPLACQVAISTIALLKKKEIQWNQKKIETLNTRFLDHLQTLDDVVNPRQIGIILAFELNIKMERYGSARNELYLHFLKEGLFIRPLGQTIYIHPPYIIKGRELNTVYERILKVIESYR